MNVWLQSAYLASFVQHATVIRCQSLGPCKIDTSSTTLNLCEPEFTFLKHRDIVVLLVVCDWVTNLMCVDNNISLFAVKWL